MSSTVLSADALDALLQPFAPEHLHWQVIETQGERLRLQPVLQAQALWERLDDVLAFAWSLELAVVSVQPAVVCAHLHCLGAKRSGIGQGLNLEAAEIAAISAAAKAFGIGQDELSLPHRWEQAATTGAASGGTSAAATASITDQDKPQAHRHIDDLVEKLRAAGLGLPTAKLMMRGYGETIEENRALYKQLRDLLAQHEAT